eukprot:1549628-Pyramimonas_sp.AAC.1
MQPMMALIESMMAPIMMQMQQQTEILKALTTDPAGSETGDEGGGGLSPNPNAVKNRARRRNQIARKRQQSGEQVERREDLEAAKRPRPAEQRPADTDIVNLVSDDDEQLDPGDLRWHLEKKAQE